MIFGIQPAWLVYWTEPTITAMVNTQNLQTNGKSETW
jgi:NAD(P)H-quinone oxidoreductase subunit 4